jgi:Class III cytochrome C family.
MKFTSRILAACLLTAFILSGLNATFADRKFTGIKMCSACHKGEKNKNVYEKWQSSAHSKAFETLKSEKSLQIAKKKGIANPSESAECLACHATNGGTGAGIKKEEGVTCEACHGAGSEYMAKAVMQNREMAVKKGLIIAKDAEHCKKCHNSKSPTFKSFVFAKEWDKIKHPVK